jgi:alpha/beta superfamily hydrolase
MIPEERVRFGTAGGPTLDGMVAHPPGATRGVVVCHPHPLYGGDMDNPVVLVLVHACWDAGLAVLRFDFRGVRRSAGVHSGGVGEQEDVRAALDLLEDRLHETPALAGYSFGAAMAAAVAAAGRPLAGLALVAPPGAQAIPAAPYPVLVVAGSDDHVCSGATLAAWRAALPGGSVHVIPGGDHFFSGGLDRLRGVLGAWTARLAATGGAGAAGSRCPPTG